MQNVFNRPQSAQSEERKTSPQVSNAKNAQLGTAKANDMNSLFDSGINEASPSKDFAFEKKSLDFKNVKTHRIPGISSMMDLEYVILLRISNYVFGADFLSLRHFNYQNIRV